VGLPSAVALSRGAEVVATDQEEAALEFAAHNARANDDANAERNLELFRLDWRRPQLGGLGLFDFVVGADVLYEALSALALAELVPGLLAPGGEAVFADPRRNTAPVFLDKMEEEHGFAVTTQETVVEQDGKAVPVMLHRLAKYG
jgi:predicted nicotinamide N-methyase